MDISALESHRQWPLAIKIYNKLKAEGFETYLAGGCVRDLVLGVAPKDIDIATEAVPEKIIALFPKTVELLGQAFGVVRVVEDGEVVEVATFRKDGRYIDGRHPEKVTYSDSKSDAERRDFTINALFLDISKKQIIDHVDGLQDIEQKIIRTVGDSNKRFEEDHLRLLRAVRFSAQLGFDIEPKTWAAVQSHAKLLKTVSEERIRDEILKLLTSSFVEKGLERLVCTGLLKVLYPDLEKSLDKQLTVWRKLADYRVVLPWTYFFWPLMEECPSWEQFIEIAEHCKLTREEKKTLRHAFFFIRLRSTWKKSRVGEKIIFYASKEGSLLLHMQANLDESWQKELDEIDEQLLQRSSMGKLPPNFLAGEDVMHLQGKARGDKLHEAYVMQLEGKLKSREEAVQWVRK